MQTMTGSDESVSLSQRCPYTLTKLEPPFSCGYLGCSLRNESLTPT